MGAVSHLLSFAFGVLALALYHNSPDFRQVWSASQRTAQGRSLSGLRSNFIPFAGPGPLMWNQSVLPSNIVSQRLTVVRNPHYGHHVFALGANGSIWHKFQTGPLNKNITMTIPMSEWHCLTKNASLVFGNDPAAAVNPDGHIELFAAFKADSYDLWQMYQTNPKDPLAWTAPRGPTCMCEDPDPAKCPWCMNCASRPECQKNYWFPGAPPFTTSDMELLLDPIDHKLRLYYRNFDGHMYYIKQEKPNKSDKWSDEGGVQLAIFE
eukprot:TRINITY_DN3171_c0_g3_i1.p1 TRINITY_DN3171_c0_g3~~TRINITY_DN3171_c0_g3_i1.p1  ORF type:complete len:265 (-),score=39.60 TRINITY_DN3171_c0_g3_i1:87-881(-)